MVSESSARLLGPTSRIRFVPDTGFSGSAAFTFHAWDETSGTVGGTADTTVNSGSSAFSAVTETAQIPVQEATFAADFDGDGDADGHDFLLWQRGFGSQAPNATKTDGDADNDNDVDVDDLGVWQLQYGTVEPLTTTSVAVSAIGRGEVVATTSLSVALPSRSVFVASMSVADAEVIDAAITLVINELPSKQIEDGFVYEDPVLLKYHSPASTKLADKASPRSDQSPNEERSTSRTFVEDETQEKDLSDESFGTLLIRIFG